MNAPVCGTEGVQVMFSQKWRSFSTQREAKRREGQMRFWIGEAGGRYAPREQNEEFGLQRPKKMVCHSEFEGRRAYVENPMFFLAQRSLSHRLGKRRAK